MCGKEERVMYWYTAHEELDIIASKRVSEKGF